MGGVRIVLINADFSENGFSYIDNQKKVNNQLSHGVLLDGATVGKARSVNSIGNASGRCTLLIPIEYSEKAFPGANAYEGTYSLLYLPAGIKSVSIKTDAVTGVNHGLVLINASTAVNEYDSGWKATGTTINKTYEDAVDHELFLASTFNKEIDKTVSNINFTVTVEY